MDAGRVAVSSIVKHALETAQAKDECLRLARYCVRLELVLVELQLLQRSNEALRGASPRLFTTLLCMVLCSGSWTAPDCACGSHRAWGHRRRRTVGEAPAGPPPALAAPTPYCPPPTAANWPLHCAGSKTVFLAIDSTVSALRQAEQLVTQVRGGG